MLIFKHIVVVIACGSLLLCALPSASNGQTASEQAPESKVWTIKMKWKTRGGQQFWTDRSHARGWRIQRNEMFGNHRLIDQNNYLIESGTYEACQQRLAKAIAEGQTSEHAGEVVIVLHGLMRSRRSMIPMAAHLEQQGYEVVNFEYASTRKKIEDFANALDETIENFGDDVTRIHFVAHSMGNLVIRKYLFDNSQSVDSRLGRFVMIGPPNNGSRMARLLKNSFLFTALTGVSGAQLSTGWDRLEPQLAIPPIDFGIVAGAQASEGKLNNYLLTGPDDFTVSLEEAKLPGARDLFSRPLLHSTMMKRPEVLTATVKFLRHGYFVSEESRRPIDRPAEVAGAK